MSAELPEGVEPLPKAETVQERADREGISFGDAAGAIEAERLARHPIRQRKVWAVYFNGRCIPGRVRAHGKAEAERLAREATRAKRSDIVHVVEA